jgi:hypothetical protein
LKSTILIGAVAAGAIYACSPSKDDPQGSTAGAGRDGGALAADGGSVQDASISPLPALDGGDGVPSDAGAPGADVATVGDGGVVVSDPDALDPAVQAKLRAGGSADASFAWLYPYDGTVLPLGIDPPVLQWSGGAADAYFVRITTAGATWEGFFGSRAPAIALDAAAWSAIAASAAPTGALTIEATILRGGAVTGPRRLTWTIAPEALPGAIYYDALGGARGDNAAVMRLAPSAGEAPTVIVGQTTCMGCHGVSADGSTIIASYGDNGSGAIFGAGGDRVRDQPDSAFTWGALSPDGKLMMSNGALAGGFPPNVSGQTQGPRPSRLYDPRTGALVPSTGWDDRIQAALMPAFSPDGTKIAFNHYDVGEGHSLSVMDVDLGARAFAGMRDIAIDPTSFLGWPTFTPDGARVVYQAGTREDYVTEQGAHGALWITSSASASPVKLAALDGATGLSFWPSIAPRAAGGYAWVAFTSRRTYGNVVTNASQDERPREKIWIAAIDLTAAPGKDPSHAPFFVSRQEIASANMRPVWALR